MATNEQILYLLKTLEAVFDKKIEPEAFRGYYWALEDYDPDVLEATGKDAVRLHKWMPKPAELREIAERKQRAKEFQHPDDRETVIFWQAMDAWGAFCRDEITEAQFDHDLAVNHVRQINGLFEAYEFEEAILADVIPASIPAQAAA